MSYQIFPIDKSHNNCGHLIFISDFYVYNLFYTEINLCVFGMLSFYMQLIYHFSVNFPAHFGRFTIIQLYLSGVCSKVF